MYVFMQCVAEAVVAKGVRGLAELVPGGGFLYDVANEAHRRLRDRKRSDQIREEVVAVAAASVEEVRRVAEQVVREVAVGASTADQAVLELYLTQVPGAVRQSFRRADDPSGRSVPDQFALADPSDLARRLPSRLPRFRGGDALPGRPGWVLGELLGTGGFGEVWLARNPSLAALKGAVKFGLDPQARERLLRHEGGLVSRVMEEGRHPNIVPLLDAYLEGDTPWLMYEYVGGGELGGLIHAWQALPPADRTTRTVAALRTLAAAVGHFHRLAPPLVHRDLKPANILLAGGRGSQPSSTPDLRVADFGIGGLAADAALAVEASRRSSGYLGSQLWGSHTPLYASPQQQRGEKPDPRDDVHALGVIGYQMLTGKLDTAPGADFARTLRRLAVPDGLIELLGDCAAHDPAHRPRDAAELAARLGALGTAAPSESVQIAACPECGVSLRFRAGATALRCTRCHHVFNPSAAPAPRPVVVEAVPAPAPAPRPESRRATPVTRSPRDDDDRPRSRRPRDGENRDHRRDHDREPGGQGVHPVLILGGVAGVVAVLLIVVFTFRTRPPVGNPPQPVAGGAGPTTAGLIKHVRTFTHPAAGQATYFRYAPDGRSLLAVAPQGQVTVLSTEGKELLTHDSKVKDHRPAFFPDGETAAVAGEAKGVQLIPVRGGGAKSELVGLEEKAVAVAVAKTGTWVAAGGDGGNVVVWNAVTRKGYPLTASGGDKAHPGGVTAAAFAPDGAQLVTAGRSGAVRVWTVSPEWTGEHRLLDAGGEVFAVGFTPDGKKLVAGTVNRGMRIWDAPGGANPTSPADGKLTPSRFARVAFSSSRWGARLAALDAGGRLGFWDGASGSGFGGMRGRDQAANDPAAADIDYHKDGDLLVVAQADQSVMIWHLFHGFPSVKLTNHGAAVVGATWSPDGKELATADRTGRVRIWGDINIRPSVGPPAEVPAP
jgi:hypothetical protein